MDGSLVCGMSTWQSGCPCMYVCALLNPGHVFCNSATTLGNAGKKGAADRRCVCVCLF